MGELRTGWSSLVPALCAAGLLLVVPPPGPRHCVERGNDCPGG